MVDKQPMLVLSKTEQDVLKVLWDAGEPLSVAEICDHAAGIGVELNQSTIQANVAKLYKKGILRNKGFSQKYKSYARTFEPTMKRADFVMIQTYQMIDYFGNADKDERLTALLAVRDKAKRNQNPAAKAEGDKGKGR